MYKENTLGYFLSTQMKKFQCKTELPSHITEPLRSDGHNQGGCSLDGKMRINDDSSGKKCKLECAITGFDWINSNLLNYSPGLENSNTSHIISLTCSKSSPVMWHQFCCELSL